MSSNNEKYNNPDWIGQKYGMLTVIEPVLVTVGKNNLSRWHWKVKCDCGNEKIMVPKMVMNSKTGSCGCLKGQAIHEKKSKYNDKSWIGKKYNMLTVIGSEYKANYNGRSGWFWKVRCDCGTEKIMCPTSVIKGKNVSCGCYVRSGEVGRKANVTHGETNTRLYSIWSGMIKRCNPISGEMNYGGRGIRVCESWHDYINFAEWARSNGYDDNLTIERKNVDGNYCPENCTWIPLKLQSRNRRTTHWVEYQGRKMSLAEACELAGIHYGSVVARVNNGMSFEDAITIPFKKYDETTVKSQAIAAGLNPGTVRTRLSNGWTLEEALSTPSLGKHGAPIDKIKHYNPKNCKICGKEFVPEHPRQVYCCIECRKVYIGRMKPIYSKTYSDKKRVNDSINSED